MLRCNFPFEYLFANVGHIYSTCCNGWADLRYYGRVLSPKTAWDVWNHVSLKALRACILEQRWEQCVTCPRPKLGHVYEAPFPEHWQPEMTVGPKSISLGNDRSCQLKCWICRENHIIDNDPCIVAAQKLILDEFLPTAEQLSFSHAGDPFISAADRQLLDLNWDRYPNLKIELFTNGLLLASNWTSLKCRPLIHRVMISMDAGTQQTYQMVRGGDWHRLLNGLSVIANEKVIRPIDLWLNMTVYSKNWRDIPAFIDLGKKFGADRIELKAFLPLWHTTYQYQSANVCDSNHPDHAELLQLIERNREALDSVDSKQLLAACGVL